jgi:glycerol-3-phosphate acyltransferase PlsX
MVTIAVDAMGGDNAPKPEVAGAIAAAREYGVKILLVGRDDLIEPELARHEEWKRLPIEVQAASDVISMHDSVVALRTKKDSSIHVANRLVRDGKADGIVSAGNTGAVMAVSKTVHGVVPGVDRPALATVMPTKTGRPVVLLDVGANSDCSPEMLLQFAIMGRIYSRDILHAENPAVGLLSIGEEEHKGNDLTKSAFQLLRKAPMNFIGNVEGRDIFKGEIDVIVCDGFTGNVALKASEGAAEVITAILKESLLSSTMGKIGAFLARDSFREMKRRTDYAEYGGAPLLGIREACIICHGSSNAHAIKNAIRVAAEFTDARILTRFEEALKRHLANAESVPIA